MTTMSPAGCVRCGTVVGPAFRFCPQCGLPVSGDSVLSTEIEDLRRRVEAQSRTVPPPGWARYLLPIAISVMLTFVAALGVVLFTPLLDRVLGPPTTTAVSAVVPRPPRWEPQWVQIPAGTFRFDDPAQERVGSVAYPYFISKYEVSNALWFEFLTSARPRLNDIWYEAVPVGTAGWAKDADGRPHLDEGRRPYPVTNVSPVAIAEFCNWLTHRLDKPGWEIRVPTRLEWEYAAHGPGTQARTYTWGNDGVLVEPYRTGGDPNPRAGLASAAPLQVDDPFLARDDSSAFGVVAIGTNVSEWTVMPNLEEYERGRPEIEETLPGDGLRQAIEQRRLVVVWRGASHGCNEAVADKQARVWFYGNSEPRDMKQDVGIRLVKVKTSGK